MIDLTTGVAEGSERPVRDDALEQVVRVTFKAPMPTNWHYGCKTKHRENPWLSDSEPVCEMTLEILAECAP